MTRHARNATAGSVYTYHEKRKDAKNSGYGTASNRIGKESVKNFDCCSLSLQPCANPVITKDGILYDKESILQYIITKKNEYARKMKEFEKQKETEEKELQEVANAEEKKKLERFLNTETNIVSSKNKDTKQGESSKSEISNMTEDRKRSLPSYWAPSSTPDAKKSKMEKPDSKIYCPITGNPLKAKDLIPIKFTKATGDKGQSSSSSEAKYMCPITFKLLGNSVATAVIATTGHVIELAAVDLIKKDWIHPLTNEKLEEKHIIYMQRGGTGYAQTNDKLEGKHYRPALQV